MRLEIITPAMTISIISGNMIRIQRHAEKVSFKGEHKLHRLGAVIAKNKHVIASGWNKAKTHPRSTHPWKYIHAEMDAIIKAGANCVGADLYVARIGRDGMLRNAKPCPFCMALIAASGIRRVYFTDKGEWSILEIN